MKLTRRRKCTVCELELLGERCACGHNETVPLLERRPILLSRELHQKVVEVMDLTIDEHRACKDASRRRLLFKYMIPHYHRILREHRAAAARKQAGQSGYRELHGAMAAQLREVCRLSRFESSRPRRARGQDGVVVQLPTKDRES